LSDAYMDERLAELGGSLMAADLEFFPKPDPCPKPETRRPNAGSKTCSDYTTLNDCEAHAADGCAWVNFGSTSACIGP